MAINDMSFNQLATVLNSIVSQATGVTNLTTATDTSSFISLAQTALKTGYDPVMNAISQVISKTIFSIRPYSAKFKGLKADAIRYGNHVRKLQVEDKQWLEDNRIKLVDGQSIDQYKVKKPTVLQTNFYGENVVSDHITIFKDQLDAAFSGPDQFGSFMSMIMGDMSDRIEQKHEETARATLTNFIAGKTKTDSANVIYLLDKYTEETGKSLTYQQVHIPANFGDFARWLFGYIETISGRLTERTKLYHQNFTNHTILRHTPIRNQKVYLYGPELNRIGSEVRSITFSNQFLNLADHEKVNFWQAQSNPDSINVKAGYTNAAGNATNGTVALDHVFGIIFDEEALGYTTINEWMSPTPFNADGGYINQFWHFTDRYWNDFTENAVVLILDHSPSIDS